ncbi:MAG: hypothetical protein V1851_02725 [Patescibacteria group bacterium]
MSEVNTFTDITKLIDTAEKTFSEQDIKEFEDIEKIFTLTLLTMRSISKFYSSDEWKDSNYEYALGVLIQSLETVLSMYSLSRSGFWDNTLVLKRNYSELLAVAIAIGYDQQCFIDWKNNRGKMKSFGDICKQISASNTVPEYPEKELLVILKRYWNESSQVYSHNISLKAIRTLVKKGQIKFEPKTATIEFETYRLRTLRNMLINILSILMGIFDYGKFTQERKESFPEALKIITDANEVFTNTDWSSQKTK